MAKDSVREILGDVGGDENWANVARFLVAVIKFIFHHCITVPCFDIDQTSAPQQRTDFISSKNPLTLLKLFFLLYLLIVLSVSLSLTHLISFFLFPVWSFSSLSCFVDPPPTPTKHARTHIHTHTQNSVHEVISPQRHFYEDALYLHGSVQPIAFQSFPTLSQPQSFV